MAYLTEKLEKHLKFQLRNRAIALLFHTEEIIYTNGSWLYETSGSYYRTIQSIEKPLDHCYIGRYQEYYYLF